MGLGLSCGERPGDGERAKMSGRVGESRWFAWYVETTITERRIAWRFGRVSFAVVWSRR